jgi:hypothetical protein
MAVQERMQPATVFKPEIASMNMGTMNFGLFPMLNGHRGSLQAIGELMLTLHTIR